MTEPYQIRVSRTARRNLSEDLPESVAAAAAQLIYGDLAANPRRVGKALLEPFLGQYSARRGTFRITYRIDDQNQIVDIVSIRHRRDAYRGQ